METLYGSALCHSYQLCATGIGSMRQLSFLSDGYYLYTTVINSMPQLSLLSNRYQLYVTVMCPIRQVSALSDRYSPVSYSTVISSYKKLIFNVLLVHHRSVLLQTFLNYQEIKKLIVATYMLSARLFL